MVKYFGTINQLAKDYILSYVKKITFCKQKVYTIINFHRGEYYQLSHGCQGDTEKYLTRGNLYHPRHTCITRDIVKGNTGVLRVIQVLQGSDYCSVLPWQPCDYDFITPKKSWTLAKFYGNSNEN